jgi:hypothetical protein
MLKSNESRDYRRQRTRPPAGARGFGPRQDSRTAAIYQNHERRSGGMPESDG